MDANDAIINQIEFSVPEEDLLEKINIVAPKGHWLTASVLQPISWSALRFCAQAVAHSHGFSVEEFGFEYPMDLDPDERTFEGVRMYAFDEEMFVSENTFIRLMLRYFEKMIEIAERRNPSVTADPWWTEYMANVSVVRDRAMKEPSQS